MNNPKKSENYEQLPIEEWLNHSETDTDFNEKQEILSPKGNDKQSSPVENNTHIEESSIISSAQNYSSNSSLKPANNGIYIAKSNAELAQLEKQDNEASEEDISANYDDYIEEKFSAAREAMENKTDNKYERNIFSSTPPKEKSAKLLPNNDRKTESMYVPYYERYALNSNAFNGQDIYESNDNLINSSPNEIKAGEVRAEIASSKAFSKQPMATRTTSAAKTAGLDLANEFKNSKISNSLKKSREKHPYLMERPLSITDQDAERLLSKVIDTPMYNIPQLANELNSEEVRYIFHALLLLDQRDEHLVPALQQIAIQRANWSMYIIAWSTLQRNFPNKNIQKTLELMYSKIISDSNRSDIKPSNNHRAISEIVNLAKSDAALVSDVVKQINQSYNLSPDSGLETFIYVYQILVRSNFGGAVLGEFFRKADIFVLYKKAEILCETLEFMHPGIAAEILSRIISNRDDINGSKLYIYKYIAEIFLQKHPDHPVWKYLSRDLIRTYKSWYVQDKISSQTQVYPAKSNFLESYLGDIEDIAMISQDIMAIRFEDFILFDDRRRGDSLMYYKDEAIKNLLTRGLEERDLVNTKLAEANAKTAISNKSFPEVVLLEILPPQLEFARKFMDRALGSYRRNKQHKSIFNNWFKQN